MLPTWCHTPPCPFHVAPPSDYVALAYDGPNYTPVSKCTERALRGGNAAAVITLFPAIDVRKHHWRLVIAAPSAGCLWVADSVLAPGEEDRVVEGVVTRRFLSQLAARTPGWNPEPRLVHTPQQEHGSNACGLIVMQLIELIVHRHTASHALLLQSATGRVPDLVALASAAGVTTDGPYLVGLRSALADMFRHLATAAGSCTTDRTTHDEVCRAAGAYRWLLTT